jgi:hypothetical protein
MPVITLNGGCVRRQDPIITVATRPVTYSRYLKTHVSWRHFEAGCGCVELLVASSFCISTLCVQIVSDFGVEAGRITTGKT